MKSFSVGKSLLRLKSSLPFNGDWLFVTASAPTEKQIDVEESFKDPDSILAGYSEATSIEAAKIIYERAKAWENAASEVAARVYDKAKAIFGAASFASTILVALSSTLLPPIIDSSFWLRCLGIAFAVLLVGHLIRSLVGAATIMTRDVFVRERPEELIELSGMDELTVLKKLTAKVLAYSFRTQDLGREKVNDLIYAQHSFRYALILYFSLALLSLTAHFTEVGVGRRKAGAETEGISELKGNIETLILRQKQLGSEWESLRNESATAQRDLRKAIELREADLELLQALSTQLREHQANRKPPVVPQIRP